MELFPKELRNTVPLLYSQDGKGMEAVAQVKFFTPDSNWTWYVTEAAEEDGDVRFFGLVKGFETELGYFMLSELQAARGPLGLPIERDLYFKPKPLSQLLEG